METTKSCPKCGELISENTTICEQCGYSFIYENEEDDYESLESTKTSNQNKVSLILKVTGCILGCIIFILGFNIGNQTASRYENMNWTVTISIWGSGFIMCLLIYAAGEIINQLSLIRINLDNRNK